MNHQTEAQLENNLIKQLQGLGYTQVTIADGAMLFANLKKGCCSKYLCN